MLFLFLLQLHRQTEPRALLTHPHGHTLYLSVVDTTEAIKFIGDTLDTAFELNNLIKYSSKMDGVFNRLQERLHQETMATGNYVQVFRLLEGYP